MPKKSAPRLDQHKDTTADICLNCHLPACISDDDFVGDETDCPLIKAKQNGHNWWEVPDGCVSMTQAAKLLGIPPTTLRNWIRTGKCPAKKAIDKPHAPYHIPMSWVNSQP